jgi:hypothetical protein
MNVIINKCVERNDPIGSKLSSNRWSSSFLVWTVAAFDPDRARDLEFSQIPKENFGIEFNPIFNNKDL